MTRFQEEWLHDPNLREWVVKVTNDESKVYCRWCSIVLRAHKSDLTGHSNTQKHAKNAASAQVTGANTGPISVQIVQQDPNSDIRMRSPKKNDKDPMFGSASAGTPVRPQYTKRYRKEWEEIDELKSWLRPYDSDSSKAYCRFCQCVLRAHRHDLVLHAKSSRHKRTEYARANGHVISGQMGISVSDGEMDVSAADSNDHDLSELDSKRARLDDVNAIEHIEIPGCAERVDPDDEHYGQISIMTTTSDDGKHDINVIKVEKDTSYLSHMDAGGIHGMPSIQPRRRKMNASKVIQAIQNNEFTGYELLQIVKCAVPKL
ncbi:hypothetical protein Ocin01_08647 [Orchesella cincta]|uniref:Uncharacterized protein n=1 Tax=Orchesella cincta TaxID=48709 RepID=A0A1D2MYA1_ORCCI|nr:hypothetical protein Ocin01_08647 [Orchesella cincta]